MVKNLKINFSNNIEIKKGIIHILVKYLQKELNFNISLLIINFVSTYLITEINIKYLNHHYSTDIITFYYNGNHNILDGELYISIDDAIYNAKKFGVSNSDEYYRLVIHGILHLLGYDDQNKNAKLVMKRLENKLLRGFISYIKANKI